MRKHTPFGWSELLTGILFVLLGIFTFIRPGSAITGLVFLYGILATLTGIADIVFYAKMENHMGFGPTISLVSGILSLLAGLMLLLHPGAGAWAMALLFPLWFITHCISRLTHLPVIVDPSHAAGITWLVEPMAKALDAAAAFDPANAARRFVPEEY